jgi:hypothetical protein
VRPAVVLLLLLAAPCGAAPRVLSPRDFGALADGRTDATAGLNAALAEAAKNGPAVLQLDAGTYYLACTTASDKPCLALSGPRGLPASGVRVRGAAKGTTLLIGNPDAGGLKVSNAVDFALSGVLVDYAVAPFTQGTISAVGQDGFDLELDGNMRVIPGSLCSAFGDAARANADASPDGRGYYPAMSWGMVMDANEERSVKRRSALHGAIHPSSCRDLGHRRFRLGAPAEDLALIGAGDRYVQLIGRNHTKTAVWIDDSRDVELKDVEVRAAAGLTTLFTGNSGKLHVDGLRVAFAPGSRRLLTSDGDGVHLSDNWAKPVIENSFFEGMADDAINIHAIASYVSASTDHGRILEIRSMREIRPGDRLELLSPQTGARHGEPVVAALAPIAGRPGYVRLGLKGPVPAAAVGDLVFDVSAAGPGALVRRNIFGRHRGRGVLFHSLGGVIEENDFRDVNWCAVQLAPDFAWHEGPNAHNVVIRRNRIHGGDLASGAQLYIAASHNESHKPAPDGPTDILIEGNSFTDAPSLSVQVSSSRRVTLRDNDVSAAPDAYRAEPGGVINVQSSADVTVTGLTVEDARTSTVEPLVRVNASERVDWRR